MNLGKCLFYLLNGTFNTLNSDISDRNIFSREKLTHWQRSISTNFRWDISDKVDQKTRDQVITMAKLTYPCAYTERK